MKRFFNYSVYLFILSIPVSSFLSVRLLLVTVILCLLSGNFSLKEGLKRSYDIIAYLLVLILGLVYSDDLIAGLKIMETNFSLLAVPFVLSGFINSDEKKINQFFHAFAAGLVMACLICLGNAAIQFLQKGDGQFFFFYKLTEVIKSHPTYLAYYLIFALTFGLYLLYYQKGNLNPLLLVALLSFFFLMLMLTGGQTSFISILFVLAFFVLKFLIEEQAYERRLTFGLVCVMIVCMFLVNLSEPDGNRSLILNDSWERFSLWKAALNATPDIFWGVGTGDDKQVLNDYYLSHNLTNFANDSYNSHNQFIQALFVNGFFGLFSVIFLIARPIYLSVKNENIFGILVFFPFLIYGITEVFLGRYQGVVFFALLHQIFMSYYTSSRPIPISLKGV